MPVNITVEDWKNIYEALYDELEFYNEDEYGISCSLNIEILDNEDTRRLLPTFKKVESILASHGVDVSTIF